MAFYPMGKTRERRIAAKTAFALAVMVCLAVLPSCRRAVGPGEDSSPAGGAGEARPPIESDRSLSLLFKHLAGLPKPAVSPAAATEEACWSGFAEQAGMAWADFDAAVLDPMRAWAAADLREARTATRTLFYPFGGPDLVTADALFPDTEATVLMGLEPVGNLPELDRAPAAWREAFFADLGELITGFLKRGYFITREMNDIYSRGKVDGALPVIAFFLGRGGYDVVRVTRLAPEENGDWIESPYLRMTVRPRRPYGIKIVCTKAGGAVSRVVYYFCCDVEDRVFRPDSALYRFFAGFGRLTTFVKSGSYLLHWGNFSTLRRFILDRSLFVLQDDTAVPYRYFRQSGWDVRLFGRYATPVEDFTNVEQPDLRGAYEAPDAAVSPLPFHFGYRWRSQVDNLLLARRSRRAYKVPVLR